MASEEPTIQEWKRAYELAEEVRKMAPWQWIEEGDIIGFEDPETGDPRYLCAMGAPDEYCTIVIYRRAQDYYLIKEATANPEEMDDFLLELSQLQVSFEEGDWPNPENLGLINKLGLKWEDSSHWPSFHSCVPGYAPGLPNRSELQLLSLGLEHLLYMAKRLKKNKKELAELRRAFAEEKKVIMRHPKGDNVADWEEEMAKLEPPEKVIDPEVNRFLLKRVSSFPQIENVLEVDLRMMQNLLEDENADRPFFAWLLLAADVESGQFAGHEILAPIPTMEAVYKGLPQALLEICVVQQVRPAGIIVRERLIEWFRETCEELNISVSSSSSLPAAEEVFPIVAESILTSARNEMQ